MKFTNKDKLFFSIILTIISIFFFKNSAEILYKFKRIILYGKKFLIIKKMPSSNCDFDYLKKVPSNSSIVIGHLYGNVSKESKFIDKKAEEFLRTNKSKIKNLFLTAIYLLLPQKKNGIYYLI